MTGGERDHDASGDVPVTPHLPSTTTRPTSTPTPAGRADQRVAYRTESDRRRALRRRANPWYWQLARGITALTIVIVVAIGLYVGARALQDYLDRDRLPAAGAEIPEIRRTSFLITSSPPAFDLQGTLTIDATTTAYEYFGRVGSSQEGVQLVSPDGEAVYVRDGDDWRAATASDTVVDQIDGALPYLLATSSADDVLAGTLRDRHVELLDVIESGEGDDTRRRYEMVVDTVAFRGTSPFEWDGWQDTVLPADAEGRRIAVTMTLDGDDVVVALSIPAINWSWERLAHSPEPFVPADPATSLLDATTAGDTGADG